jgi:thiamine-phosphate pyrophosphorylase
LQNYSKIKIINRIIDANLNRTKEGLRVLEEISRFILNNRDLTAGFKKIRHKVDATLELLPPKKNLLKERESLKDIGFDICVNEFKRKDITDIYFANLQRIKESVRVLEEFSKLINLDCALRFKKIRYTLYEIEKKAAGKISSLSYLR